MYDLTNHFDNTFDVMNYTISAMKEVGFSQGEIDDYLEAATRSDNSNLIDVSVEYVNKCNEATKSYKKDDNFWDLYSNELDEHNDDSYKDDYFTGDLYLDDGDCYEGFNTCRHYYWDTDDEDDDSVNQQYNCYSYNSKYNFDYDY